MAKGGFYAVAAGRSTGVFTTWSECEAQVKGFTDCRYKKFKTQGEAQAFMDAYNGTQSNPKVKRPRDYSTVVEDELKPPSAQKLKHDNKAQSADTSKPAVAKGRKTGVFRTWKEAKIQVENLFSASFKKFPTKEEAEAFVNQHAASTTRLNDDPDPKDPKTLVAFCDGSALENGRRKCRAGYACIFPHCEQWNVAKQLVEDRATNNRAEYMAALEAMKRANVEDPERSRMLYIFSDSMLLIRSMTEWVGTWQKNNWNKSDGTPVQNRDLLELLVAEKGSRRIRWTHVKAHTRKQDWRSKWNDVADNAARNAALSVGGK
ncbi:ribonuclease, putative [Phytophthora infestans T30-4]|uniref:ribonuclease H n=1 Tax=Phytophthora infestans (strain T30-4) TaxID=403677 RepID=D0NEW7_PHYIT|nr:ribonuclease, putative [Phytophthora infestans T30-4]EEY56756.1 ribonuclease, putative [Phytophthora infestans T30-4]|eukprot:XP_002902084.1 ribonuclease, putative [Phytophthora infestans T30-4]